MNFTRYICNSRDSLLFDTHALVWRSQNGCGGAFMRGSSENNFLMTLLYHLNVTDDEKHAISQAAMNPDGSKYTARFADLDSIILDNDHVTDKFSSSLRSPIKNVRKFLDLTTPSVLRDTAGPTFVNSAIQSFRSFGVLEALQRMKVQT